MKNIILIILAVALLSCQEEDKTALVPDNLVSVNRNSLSWKGAAEIHLNTAIDPSSDTLTILAIGNQPNDEVIVMKVKFSGLGTYQLINKQAFYYSTIGGDGITSEYKLAPNAFGTLIISTYDTSKNHMEGTFEMTLTQSWSNPKNDIETLNFTEGHFRGGISN